LHQQTWRSSPSFNIEEVQRDVDQFSVPGEEELLNQMVCSHLDGDRLLDYLKWCEEALPRRERIPFPKKYAPPPKTAPKPPTRRFHAIDARHETRGSNQLSN
jgi:hypothetical protein